MKIISYKQLDEIVAQSLDWKTTTELIDIDDLRCNKVYYYYPPNLTEDEGEEFVDNWGIAPDFCHEFSIVEEFLLPECDRFDCLIEIVRTKEATTCQIKPNNPQEREFKYFSPITVGLNGLHNSLPLATCLAWLSFKGVEFELEMEDELA